MKNAEANQSDVDTQLNAHHKTYDRFASDPLKLHNTVPGLCQGHMRTRVPAHAYTHAIHYAWDSPHHWLQLRWSKSPRCRPCTQTSQRPLRNRRAVWTGRHVPAQNTRILVRMNNQLTLLRFGAAIRRTLFRFCFPWVDSVDAEAVIQFSWLNDVSGCTQRPAHRMQYFYFKYGFCIPFRKNTCKKQNTSIHYIALDTFSPFMMYI